MKMAFDGMFVDLVDEGLVQRADHLRRKGASSIKMAGLAIGEKSLE